MVSTRLLLGIGAVGAGAVAVGSGRLTGSEDESNEEIMAQPQGRGRQIAPGLQGMRTRPEGTNVNIEAPDVEPVDIPQDPFTDGETKKEDTSSGGSGGGGSSSSNGGGSSPTKKETVSRTLTDSDSAMEDAVDSGDVGQVSETLMRAQADADSDSKTKKEETSSDDDDDVAPGSDLIG